MKKLIICLLILFLGAGYAYAKEFNFRDAKWSMNQTQIKAIEKGQLIIDNGWYLRFDIGSIYNAPCAAFYMFTEEAKFARGGYELYPPMSAIQEKYELFKDGIEIVYGIARTDEVIWRDEMSKRMFGAWPFVAIGIGALKYQTTWQFEDLLIILAADRDDNEDIVITVTYFNLELHSDMQKQIEKVQRETAQSIF